MRTRLLLLAFALSLFMVGKSHAISFTQNGISYVANADTAIIKGYNEIPEDGELTLASTVERGGKTYTVTTVQSSAFLACTDITKLTIPASIKYIQASAFENCVNLTTLVLSEGEDILDADYTSFKNCAIEDLTLGRNLKNSTFSGNKTLSNVTLLSNIKEILPRAFSVCTNLKTINLQQILKIGNSAFYQCKSLNQINLECTDTIGELAFQETSLTSIVLSSSLTKLGRQAFAYCQSLETVNISACIENIPNSCFSNCSSLKSIDFSQSIKRIDDSAFYLCSSLTQINLMNIESIGNNTFAYCKKLENIEWGNVTKIGDNAFVKTNLKELTIPAQITDFGKNIFEECTSLSSCNFLPKISTIPEGCFRGCTSLNSISYPESVIKIGNYAFNNTGFNSFTFLPSIKIIGNSAFGDCKNLANIDWVNIDSIGESAFAGCKFSSINLPASIQYIENSSFSSCGNLKEVNLSNTNITKIPTSCFAYCKNLSNIILAANTSTIGYSAFYGCEQLSTIENADSITEIGTYAFDKTKYLENQQGDVVIGKALYAYKGEISDGQYFVPKYVETICTYALENQKLQTIQLPKNIKRIEQDAFKNCAELISLTIPSKTEFVGGSEGCSKLSVISILASKEPLQLKRFKDSTIKKFYVRRNLTGDIDWFNNMEKLYIGQNVAKLSAKAFKSCTNLTDLEIEDANTGLNMSEMPINNVKTLYVGRNIYLPKLNLPQWEVQTDIFSSVEELNFGEQVDSICEKFAYGNSHITELNLPANLKYIGNNAFYNCDNLTEINLPNSVKELGEYAFAMCRGLQKAKLPESMKEIPVGLFNDDTNLESINMPSNLVKIGDDAFHSTSLQKIKFPSSLREIGMHAFNSSKLDSVILTGKCKLLLQCFYNTPVKFADVRNLDGNLNLSFSYCQQLEEILMPEAGPTEITGEEFWEDINLKKINIPNTVTKIEYEAFSCTSIERLEIPESVTNVSCMILGWPRKTPSVYILGNNKSTTLKMDRAFMKDWMYGIMQIGTLQVNRSLEYNFDDEKTVKMDSLIIGDINTFDILSREGHTGHFSPTTAICLSSHLTSCDMWKPESGKIFVLPGSQLPADDITYMYTVNKLNYKVAEGSEVLFDGINNMPFEITPVFYQANREVSLDEPGQYDLSMKISGTSFDGIYSTGLQVTVTTTSGINNVTIDEQGNCPVYNLNGQRVDDSYKGVVIQNGKKRIAM